MEFPWKNGNVGIVTIFQWANACHGFFFPSKLGNTVNQANLLHIFIATKFLGWQGLALQIISLDYHRMRCYDPNYLRLIVVNAMMVHLMHGYQTGASGSADFTRCFQSIHPLLSIPWTSPTKTLSTTLILCRMHLITHLSYQSCCEVQCWIQAEVAPEEPGFPNALPHSVDSSGSISMKYPP